MNRVAITGLGVISPVGQDIETVFANLRDGVCGVGQDHPLRPLGDEDLRAAEVMYFDPEAFGISRGDTRRMDLFTQIRHGRRANRPWTTAASSAPSPGAPRRLRWGSGIGGMNTFMAECKKLFDRNRNKNTPLFIPMMIGNIAAGNIAIRYGCKGPSLPVVTACATSTNTIGEAFRAIRYGYADAILAGGSEATVNPLAIGGFANCKALTEADDPEAASLPFEQAARRLRARRGRGRRRAGKTMITPSRAARISTRRCAATATPATPTTSPRPTPRPRAARAPSAWRMKRPAAPKGSSTSTPTATGTPLNDSSETLAIKKALGEEKARAAMVSSTKSMTGHMLGAAGAFECVACALALARGTIFPTIHLESPTPPAIWTMCRARRARRRPR